LFDSEPDALPLGVVVLRHAGEHPRTARRIDVTRSLISDSVDFVEDVWARGSSPLARLLDLIATGDHASTYLAVARGVDPAPIAAIDTLKAALGT
jgi:glucose/mannose-6-phosphate isomerase